MTTTRRRDDDLVSVLGSLIEHYAAERRGETNPLRYAELTGRLEALQEVLGWLLQRGEADGGG